MAGGNRRPFCQNRVSPLFVLCPPLLFIGLDFWWFICHRLFPFRMWISVAWGVGVLFGLGRLGRRHAWARNDVVSG
ncbi:hypothetical protein Peur_041927 [Populus x canadensis]